MNGKYPADSYSLENWRDNEWKIPVDSYSLVNWRDNEWKIPCRFIFPGKLAR
jgi:hypothetical protein